MLSNDRRMQIVEWLRDPEKYFPPQRDGDLIEDGVCVGLLTRKLAISQPSVTAHMRQLEQAGLVTGKPIKNWVFYKLNQNAINELLAALRERLGD